MSENSKEMSKQIIFPDRLITKSTMCANCVHFDADSTRILEEWQPVKEELERGVRKAIVATGLEMEGFERGDVALKVAHLAARGISTEDAIQLIEQEQRMEAYRRAGDEPWKADVRYKLVAFTERDIKSGKVGRCRGGGLDKDDKPVGFLVFSAHHCRKWTGRTGHSLAHEGRPLDPLPAELHDIADSKAKSVKDND
jgi:hypothetical protein